MDTVSIISGISTVVSIIELIRNGYKWTDNITIPSKIDIAYARALKKWAPNNGIRASYANSQFSTLKDLSEFIVNKDSKKGEIKSLLECFEEELRKDNCTYLFILEIIERENLASNRRIENCVNEVNQKMDNGLAKLSIGNNVTHNLLYTIINHLENTSKTTLKPIIYSDINGYIRRTVRPYSSYDINIYLDRTKYESRPLSEYIIGGTRLIVLYSDAQLGKSTELKRLAFELYDSKLYNPFLFNLSQYSGKQRLEELVRVPDRFNSDKIDVLILDGLDEVSDDNRADLIIEIENISQNYPNLFIVVSCRSNFEGTNNISGFKKLYLDELSWNDVEVYIKKRCAQYEDFLQEIRKKEYYEIALSPFYLNEGIKYFQENGELPKNKTVLYDSFIDKCFLVDNERRPYKGRAISLKIKLYPVIEQIAFCLLSAQRQEITVDELNSELGIKEDLIQLCLGISLLDNDGQNNLKFIHNSFKEYFVAKYLSKLSFEQIRSVICYNNTTKIKPTMYNTSVLLLSMINRNDDLFEPFTTWLISDYKKLLIRCGFEAMEEEQRNNIFVDVFNDYKQKHLWIEYEFSKPFIQFANTKSILQFLLNQIKDDDSFSINMINALSLLKHAEFELMQAEEFNQAKQLLLDTLRKYQDNVEYGSYLCRPFENTCFLTSNVISEIFEVIKGTTNCNIINYFCTLICKINQCDEYAKWIFSKAHYIHDYTDERGIKHYVSNDYLIRFLKCLKIPHNILQAIQFNESLQEKNYSRSKDDNTCETLLFSNLLKYSNKSSEIVDEVILNIKTIKQRKITIIKCKGYYSFFSANSNAEEIFQEYYTIVKRLLKEISKNNNKDKLTELYQSFNIVVILLDDNRLAAILSDDTIDEELLFRLCNILPLYPVINEEIISKINLRFEHLNSKRIDWDKRKRESYNILFERELFNSKVKEAIAGKQRILTNSESRRLFLSMNTNGSVINFIWWCKENKQPYVDALIIEEKLNSDVDFICFFLSQIHTSSEMHGGEQITINEKQRETLNKTINFALMNHTKFSHIEVLIPIIIDYNLLIEDQLLITLFSYSHMHVNYKRKSFNNHSFYDSSVFLDYLEDNISDGNILDQTIEKWIKTNNNSQCQFWQIVTKHIVEYKKRSLYKYFKTLMDKSSDYSFKLNNAVTIADLGHEGISIVNDMLDCLNENEKIYYYEHILFPEDKSDVIGKERSAICKTLESKYSTYEEDIKGKVLDILLRLGSSKALDWGLEYEQSHKEWAYRDHFPSLHYYNGDNIDKLRKYFDIATSINISQVRIHSMIDSVIYALQRIANETEEMRDKVIAIFKQKANHEGLYFLNRTSEETYDKYFENNFGVMTLKQASLLYHNVTDNN